MKTQRRTDTSFANPLVGRRELERRQAQHRENIHRIKSSIDTRAPAPQPHLTLYGRDYVSKKRATTEAAFSDLKMIQSIARTMTRAPSLPARKGPSSLNADARKSEIVKVMQENHRLLGRLETLDPVISTKDYIKEHQWKQRYVINASHTRRLCGEYDGAITRIRKEDKSLMDSKAAEAERRRSRHLYSQSMSSSMSAPSLLQNEPAPPARPKPTPKQRRLAPLAKTAPLPMKTVSEDAADAGDRRVSFRGEESPEDARHKEYPATPYAAVESADVFFDDPFPGAEGMVAEEPLSMTATSQSAGMAKSPPPGHGDTLTLLAQASVSPKGLGPGDGIAPRDSPRVLDEDDPMRTPADASASDHSPPSAPPPAERGTPAPIATDQHASGSLDGSPGRDRGRTTPQTSPTGLRILAEASASGRLSPKAPPPAERGTPEADAIGMLASGSLDGSLGRNLGRATPQGRSASPTDRLAFASLDGSIGALAAKRQGSPTEASVPQQEFDPAGPPDGAVPGGGQDEDEYDDFDDDEDDDGGDRSRTVGASATRDRTDYSFSFEGDAAGGSRGATPLTRQGSPGSRPSSGGSSSSGSGAGIPPRPAQAGIVPEPHRGAAQPAPGATMLHDSTEEDTYGDFTDGDGRPTGGGSEDGSDGFVDPSDGSDGSDGSESSGSRSPSQSRSQSLERGSQSQSFSRG